MLRFSSADSGRLKKKGGIYMELNEIMQQKRFAILGDTMNPEKYAYKIKHQMRDAGYTVYAVGKELSSLNDIDGDIDIIDLCIHPVKGLKLLKENRKPFRCIVIQPGADSPELLAWLDEQNIPYIHGCLLVGLSLYEKC